MPKYNFSEQEINKEKNTVEKKIKLNDIKEAEKKEDNELYKSLDCSLNSMSNFDVSSISSEKDSINESMGNIGNIKDQSNLTIISNVSKTDIQEEM